jgi:hypothetical protein
MVERKTTLHKQLQRLDRDGGIHDCKLECTLKEMAVQLVQPFDLSKKVGI